MGIVVNSLSFFLSNFIYLVSFYLGCVVFVYSEKKDKQAVVASISFMLCSLFFIGHLLVIGKGISFILSFSSRIIFPSFFILSLLPFAWSYIVFQFYEENILWKRFRIRKVFLLLEIIFFLLSFALLLYFVPATGNKQVSDIIFLIPDEVFHVFSFYILFCTVSSIIYLFQIQRKDNNLEEIASNSAFSTILRASFILAALAVLVVIIGIFGKLTIEEEVRNIQLDSYPLYLLLLDFFACLAVCLTLYIIGRAVISYQVFTGRYLAMKSLKEYWKYILFFVILYSLFSTLAVILNYSTDLKQILLSLIGLLFFVKIQTISRKREIENRKILKPFLFNENLYDSITMSSSKIETQLNQTFHILCDNTLETSRACLVPMGAYSSYIQTPLFYPENNSSLQFNFLSLVENFPTDQNIFYINRDTYDGYVIAQPIKDSNGFVGILFLGVKKDYTLYSEEEIEIARIGCGKILDLLSVTAISRLLVNLQKKQLMDSKLLDHQTRRVLHDDILPEIHTILIKIDSLKNESVQSSLLNSLSDLHKKISNLLKILPIHPTNLSSQSFIEEIQKLVKSELAGESVFFFFKNEALEKLSELEPITLEVAYYAVRELLRNISRYAKLPDRKLEVNISLSFEKTNLELSIEDNGKGIQNSVENLSGAGQGLILHSTMMAVVGGSLIKESHPNEFTRVRLILKKFFI